MKKSRHASPARTQDRPDWAHPSRQNEYIDELEGLLLQIQSGKRKADLEFESARRTAMEENQNLRTLLRRIGITDAEVETYLSNSDYTAMSDVLEEGIARNEVTTRFLDHKPSNQFSQSQI